MNEFCFGKKSVPPLLYCNAQKKFDGNCECFFSSAVNSSSEFANSEYFAYGKRNIIIFNNLRSGQNKYCMERKIPAVPYAVGWSDLALFTIFGKRHMSADQVYF